MRAKKGMAESDPDQNDLKVNYLLIKIKSNQTKLFHSYRLSEYSTVYR